MSNTKNRLSLLIKDHGLNQKEFAKISNVDVAIICRILKGETEPNVKTLRKIAETTNTSVNWLLGYGPDTPIERMD